MLADVNVVEVNCPWSLHDGTRSVFSAALHDKSFFLCVTDNCDVELRTDHPYYNQVQDAMEPYGLRYH